MSRTSLRALLAAAGAALAMLSLASADAEASAKLRLVKRLWATGEVRVVEGGRERLLERYPAPISVEDSEVSPDGRRAFIWYRGARPPLQLAIYDLRTLQRTARFAPGFGGEIHFTPGGNLIHIWGCGSNCQSFALYDGTGRTLHSGGCTGNWLSPTRRYFLTGPSFWSDNEPVRVYDLDEQRTIAKIDPPKADTFIVDETVRWDEVKGVLVAPIRYLHGKARSVHVKLAAGQDAWPRQDHHGAGAVST